VGRPPIHGDFDADSTAKHLNVSEHFAKAALWKSNTAEIMKHPRTDQKGFQDVIEFAKRIGMAALPLYKEQPGYILNSLLVSS
jgi:3-hydroxyacyl-CoA dehydrogenase